MMRILMAAAVAALAASPAEARPYAHSALNRAWAQVSAPGIVPGGYGYSGYGYWDSHFGGGARGSAAMPLGGGTANSPGGIVGGGPGAYR